MSAFPRAYHLHLLSWAETHGISIATQLAGPPIRARSTARLRLVAVRIVDLRRSRRGEPRAGRRHVRPGRLAGGSSSSRCWLVRSCLCGYPTA
jgi:hypothetical protein